MPGLDARIERALRESARSPDADPGIVARGVAHKRARRQTRRNAATSALVAAVLVVTAVVTVTVLRRDGGEDRRISTPPSTTAAQPADPVAAQKEIEAALPGTELSAPAYLSSTEAVVDMESARGVRVEYVEGAWRIDPASACRIDAAVACGPPDVRVTEGFVPLGPEAYAGTSAGVARLPRPVTEYARTPLVSTSGASWVAVYEREGADYRFPPSHLVNLNGGQRIDLEGEILSLAAGEDGTVWAVTRDRVVDTDGTEFRLKRIDEDLRTNPIPAGEQPAGGVVVGGGGAWVPVVDGVLQFDLATGEYRGKIPLTGLHRRGVVVVDGRTWVTGDSTLQQVDVAGVVATLATASTAPLTDVVLAGDSVWAVAATELVRLDRQVTAVEARVPLPAGFTPSSLAASGDRVVIAGTADLAGAGEAAEQSVAVEPVVLVVDGSGVLSTIVIAGGADTVAAFDQSGDLLLTSNGSLYRARLP